MNAYRNNSAYLEQLFVDIRETVDVTGLPDKEKLKQLGGVVDHFLEGARYIDGSLLFSFNDDNKPTYVSLIRTVRAAGSLGLKESKDLVDEAIKERCNELATVKQDNEAIQKLEEKIYVGLILNGRSPSEAKQKAQSAAKKFYN